MHGATLWMDDDGQLSAVMKHHLVATVNNHAFMAASTGYLLDAALRDEGTNTGAERDARRHVFAAVEQIVLYAGRISALIDPLISSRKLDPAVKRLRDARTEFMREVFDAQRIPTLLDRAVRNTVEHYDERVEVAIANARPGAGWVTDMIGPSTGIVLSGGSSGIWQRRFDPDTGEFEILGETTNLQTLMAEIHIVYDISGKWLDSHSRDGR